MIAKSIDTKNTLKIVGVLILFRFAFGILGLSIAGHAENLNEVAKNITNIKISILIDLLTDTASVATAVLLFPILRTFSDRLSLWFLVFSGIGFANMVQANVNVYTLISCTQDYLSKGAIGNTYYENFAKISLYKSEMSHFYGLIIHCLGTFGFYFILFKFNLIPKFITTFALMATFLVFINTFPFIFDVKTTMFLYLPNAILQISLGFWLIAKGFNFSEK